MRLFQTFPEQVCGRTYIDQCLPCRFATREPNGLLLYNGRFNEKHDFIAMEIISEQIQLTYSAGRAPPSPAAAPRSHFPLLC